MEIKVAEIDAPLINGVEINVHKKNATLILMNFWNPC